MLWQIIINFIDLILQDLNYLVHLLSYCFILQLIGNTNLGLKYLNIKLR